MNNRLEDIEKLHPALFFQAEKELRAWLIPQCRSYTSKLYREIDDVNVFNLRYEEYRQNALRVSSWILWYPIDHNETQVSLDDVKKKFTGLIPDDQLASILETWFK